MGLRSFLRREPAVERAQLAEVDGLMDIAVPAWYRENLGVGLPAYGDARYAERVWVANRCQQMNAQQIASMPLEFHGGGDTTPEPLWVSNPDPHWYPNGIGDAIHSIIDQVYGWGFACLYVTEWYATGYPRAWTVLDSCNLAIKVVDGAREYRANGDLLDPERIVQIDRNPGRVHGTSALRAYGQLSRGLITAGDQAQAVNDGGTPLFYLKSKRPLSETQALAIQEKWAQRTQERRGMPPVLPPDIDAQEMSFDPASLALLENQEFGAKAIASAYGVPSVLLNMALSGGMTYQNPAALGEMWWRFELRPTATKVANALSAQLLPRGQYVSFKAEDTFAPLTPDSAENDEQAAVDDPASAPPVPTAGNASGGSRLAAV